MYAFHAQVTYYTREGQLKTVNDVFGYYFEGDWGLEHNRVQSLIYSQLWDMWDAFDISMNGTVTVKPDDVTRPCEFQYNYWN